jgi:hypothetical protein
MVNLSSLEPKKIKKLVSYLRVDLSKSLVYSQACFDQVLKDILLSKIRKTVSRLISGVFLLPKVLVSP